MSPDRQAFTHSAGALMLVSLSLWPSVLALWGFELDRPFHFVPFTLLTSHQVFVTITAA